MPVALPRPGDYIVVPHGVAVVQDASKDETYYAVSYERRKDPDRTETNKLVKIGDRAWKTRGCLVRFRIGPVGHPEWAEEIVAKSISDAVAKFKRIFGTRLFKISKSYIMRPGDWADLFVKVNKYLADLVQNSEPSKWLSIKILGCK